MILQPPNHPLQYSQLLLLHNTAKGSLFLSMRVCRLLLSLQRFVPYSLLRALFSFCSSVPPAYLLFRRPACLLIPLSELHLSFFLSTPSHKLLLPSTSLHLRLSQLHLPLTFHSLPPLPACSSALRASRPFPSLSFFPFTCSPLVYLPLPPRLLASPYHSLPAVSSFLLALPISSHLVPSVPSVPSIPSITLIYPRLKPEYHRPVSH